MNNNNLIMAILLVFVVILSATCVSAEDNAGATILQESDNIATTSGDGESILSSTQTITAGSDSDSIQAVINNLSDGDTLNFEAGEYDDICIYVNKNITINGNGATLIGYDTPSKNNTPSIIWSSTAEGGYAIGNLATFYIVNTDGVVINGLNIVGGAHSADTYSNALVYATKSNNMVFENNTLDGSSWGLYLQYCNDGVISGNTIKNQEVTGILNFGSARTLIENNKIIDAKNHGIDVRHGTGPNVQVLNNTVIASKEGIYLMHSQGHSAYNNTLINCTISSISCYGSSNIDIRDNKMQKSRIGVLLGGGYKNIHIGENTFTLDNLPFPPTFVYYVAEAKSDYQSAENMMGTFSDSSTNSPNYVAYTGIDTPKDIYIDYNSILKKTGTIFTVPEDYTNDQIQTMIDAMSDGDSIVFAKEAVYTNISIYTDKNIKIFGNNATLIGFDNIDLANVPEKVKASTSEGGYAVAYRSVLYVINTTGAVVSELKILAQYPGYDTTKATTTTDEYKSSGIYATDNKNLTITGCDVTGASWGIFEQYSSDSIISRNNVHDVYTTGIMNFGSPRALIVENTISDAANHGIDVRHGTGPNVTIAFNDITGSKEGIYLMHSKGHTVYNNTIKDSKISGITALGSGNEALFNNSISGSRIGVLLSQGYYNVTIGENTYNLDFLPFPPTFVTYLARAESMYQSADDVMRLYSDKETVTIIADNVETEPFASQLNFTLVDQNGKLMENTDVIVTIGDEVYPAITDSEGSATIDLNLTPGEYEAVIEYAGTDSYAPASATVNISVSKIDAVLTVPDVNITYGVGGSIVATLSDVYENPISGVNVKITAGSIAKTLKTDANGQVSLDVSSLEPGTYTVSAKSATTDVFNRATATAKAIVSAASKLATTLEVDDVEAPYNSGEITATLIDENGDAVKGVNVKITVGNIAKTLKTDANGQVALDISSLEVGTYTASVKSATTALYERATATASVIINKIDTELIVPDVITIYNTTGSVVATLQDVDGNAISGVNVKITVGNLAKTLKTNTDGKVALDISSLELGTYTVAVKSATTDIYNRATASATAEVVSKLPTTLIVPDVVAVCNKTGSVVATLLDINGNAIKGVNVKITVGSLAKTLKTNADGQVALDISSLDIGTYTVAVKSATTDIYERATATATAEVVSKLPTTLIVPDVTTEYNNGTVVANLIDANGNAVSGVNVKITVGDIAKTLKTNADGQVALDISSLTPGTYTANIKSATTDIYERATATSSVIVNKVNTTLTAIQSGKNIVATLKDVAGNAVSGVNVKITVGNIAKTLKTNAAGQVTLDISSLDSGSYTANIKSASSSIYNWADPISLAVTV